MVRNANSEYGRAFRANLSIYAPLHASNVEIRTCRRSKEHGHNRDSFIWDDTASEASSGSIQAINETKPRPLSAPLHKYKHEKFNELYRARKTYHNAHAHGDTLNHEQHKQLVKQLEQSLHLNPTQDVIKNKTKISPQTPPPSIEEPAEICTRKVEDRQVQTPDWSKLNAQGNHQGYINLTH